MSYLRTWRIGLSAVAGLLAPWTAQPSRAATLTFTPFCSNIWQDCCDCGGTHKCNNWGQSSPAPLCPALPTGSDVAIIPADTDCVIAPTPPAAGAAALDLQQQPGGTLFINGNLSADTAALDGFVEWTSGTISRVASSAIWTAANGVTLSGSDPKSLAGSTGGVQLINEGYILWTGTGAWTIGNAPGGALPGVLQNNLGSTLDVQTDAPILQAPQGLGLINNDGTLAKTVATGTSDWKVQLNNSGLVHVQSGTVRLTGAGSSTGEYRTDAGATLAFANSFTVDLESGATITGAGDTIVEDTGSGNAIDANAIIDIERMSVLNSGSIGGTGELRIHDQLSLTGAICSVPVRILGSAELLVSGGLTSTLGDLTVEGTARISNAQLTTPNKSFTIPVGGVVELEDSGIMSNGGLVPIPIENYGQVHKTVGTGTGSVLGAFSSPFNHHAGALVHAAAGTLQIDMVLNSEGDWQVDDGAAIEFIRVTAMNPGSTFGGIGWYRLLQNSNFFRIAGGVHLAPARLQVGDATRSPVIDGVSGAIGSLTVTDTLTWIRGTVNAAQPFLLTIPFGATLSLEGTTMSIGSTNLALAGTANIVSTSTVSLGGVGVWNIQPTGVLDIQVDASISGGNRPIHNAGTMVRSVGTGTAAFSFTNLTNTGVVRSESGELRFTSGNYTQTAGRTELAGGAMLVSVPLALNGGRLLGTGTIAANITNSGGYVEPGASAGLLTVASNASPAIAGNYTQGTGGTLEIELGGLTPGSEHDQLVVADTASLNGVLRLMPIDGFIPGVGDSFVILTAGARTGTFSHVIGPGQYSVAYNPTNVTVTGTTAPACSDLSPADLNFDCTVDLADYELLHDCLDGPGVGTPPVGCSQAEFSSSDLDFDHDADLTDYRIFQELFAQP